GFSFLMPTILITGSAGLIGTMLRARLAGPGRTLRLLDLAPVTAGPGGEVIRASVTDLDAVPGAGGGGGGGVHPGRASLAAARAPGAAGPGEEVIRASVTDLDAVQRACGGADAVIHLAGHSVEAPWQQISEVNIGGTYAVFEAARRAGVTRVIFASSNHAVGFSPPSSYPVPDYAFPAPDTYYGVSKAAGEALGAMYHHRYGLDVICLRILTCADRPPNVRALSTWLSPDDAGRLFEACLAAPSPGFRVAYGVSA